MAKRPQWPYGQPTVVCPRCAGSGVEAGAAVKVFNERTPPPVGAAAEKARLVDIACRQCAGRGRVINSTAGAL
jgi:DnaJ-class molecular chaperone